MRDVLPPDPDDALEAAEQAALDAVALPTQSLLVEPAPLGRAPTIDPATGRLVISPAGEVVCSSGLDTLRDWCLKAVVTPRGAGRALSPNYGMDGGGLQSLIGRAAQDVDPEATLERVRAAWIRHPRIADVDGIDVQADETEEIVSIHVSALLDFGDRLEVTV